MNNNKRIKLELQILNNLNITYIFNNNIVEIYTNIGILCIEINKNYPFTKPNIFFKKYYIYIFKLLYKQCNLNFNICLNIISKLQKKIYIKDYIYNLISNHNKYKWCILFDSFYNNWSPSLWIFSILNFILNINHINDNYKIIIY